MCIERERYKYVRINIYIYICKVPKSFDLGLSVLGPADSLHSDSPQGWGRRKFPLTCFLAPLIV